VCVAAAGSDVIYISLCCLFKISDFFLDSNQHFSNALLGLHYFSGEKMMEMEMIIWTLVLATIIAVSFYCYNVYSSRRRGNKNENTDGSAEQKSKDVK
jgi:hypothetical protein